MTDLKHLNLSDNNFSPPFLQKIVSAISKNDGMQLLSLNLSRNQMPPLKELVVKKNNNAKAEWDDEGRLID